ncbi:MAG: hypothetical protein ABIA47_03735 [bacterium]
MSTKFPNLIHPKVLSQEDYDAALRAHGERLRETLTQAGGPQLLFDYKEVLVLISMLNQMPLNYRAGAYFQQWPRIRPLHYTMQRLDALLPGFPPQTNLAADFTLLKVDALYYAEQKCNLGLQTGAEPLISVVGAARYLQVNNFPGVLRMMDRVRLCYLQSVREMLPGHEWLMFHPVMTKLFGVTIRCILLFWEQMFLGVARDPNWAYFDMSGVIVEATKFENLSAFPRKLDGIDETLALLKVAMDLNFGSPNDALSFYSNLGLLAVLMGEYSAARKAIRIATPHIQEGEDIPIKHWVSALNILDPQADA